MKPKMLILPAVTLGALVVYGETKGGHFPNNVPGGITTVGGAVVVAAIVGYFWFRK